MVLHSLPTMGFSGTRRSVVISNSLGSVNLARNATSPTECSSLKASITLIKVVVVNLRNSAASD